MAVTIQTFLVSFPEFATSDANLILQLIEQLECEACYDVFPTKLQDLAIKLHVAHLVALQDQTKGGGDCNDGGRIVKRLKSKQDEIEFQQVLEPYSIEATYYGVRLRDLLERNQVGFNPNWCW